MLKKIIIIIFGNIKLLFIKLFHFRKFHYNLYNNVNLLSSIDIDRKSKIKLGKKFILRSNSILAAHAGGEIIIGDKSFINRGCYVVSHKKILIGNHVSIGPNTTIVDHDHMFDKNGIKSRKYEMKEIIIEDGAWIGANCIILKGCKIGKNSVIAAGSVVNSDVPSNTIFVQKKNSNLIPIK